MKIEPRFHLKQIGKTKWKEKKTQKLISSLIKNMFVEKDIRKMISPSFKTRGLVSAALGNVHVGDPVVNFKFAILKFTDYFNIFDILYYLQKNCLHSNKNYTN